MCDNGTTEKTERGDDCTSAEVSICVRVQVLRDVFSSQSNR